LQGADPAVFSIEAPTHGGVGAQNIWLIEEGDKLLEIVETVIEFVPPNRVASSLIFTRFIPLPRELWKPGVVQPLGDELTTRFRLFYGGGRPEGVSVMTVTEASGCSEVTMAVEMKVGGLAMVIAFLARMFGVRPLQRRLDMMKRRLEAGPDC
jgi:hypothetical protein